jgi:tetratricopeptide (TPR) repeat protein
MRRLLFSAVLAMVWVTVPAFADDERDCFQQADPQARIKGCSDTIQRNPNDATAYHNRAVAYGLAGDVDHAIADYSKAIEMRPDNSVAYENRGRAYASKGDYTRALADVMKASELTAKARAQTHLTAPKPVKTTIAAPPKTKTMTDQPKTAMIALKKAIPQARNNVVKQLSDGRPAWALVLDHSAD